MKKVTLDFSKPYNKQTTLAKELVCEHDFYEIANLLHFKKRLKDKRGK